TGRVVDDRSDLALVADDPDIAQKSFYVTFPESGHHLRVEPGKCSAKVLTLVEDGQPGQAGLESFQADLLEQSMVVGDGPSPLQIVVPPVDVRSGTPGAPWDAIVTDYEIGHSGHGRDCMDDQSAASMAETAQASPDGGSETASRSCHPVQIGRAHV